MAGTETNVDSTGGGPHALGEHMPRWLPRAIATTFVYLPLFLLAVWSFQRLTGILTLLLVAFFVSLAMEPAVGALVGKGMNRALATALVFILLFAGVVGFLAALVTLLVETTTHLVDRLPSLVDSTVRWVNSTFHQNFSLHELTDRLLHDSNIINNYAQQAAGNIWGVSSTLLGEVVKVFTIALFSVYMTAGGPKLRRTVCSLLPPERQAAVLHAWDLAIEKTGGYLYSRALLAVISTVTHGVFLWLLDIPNAAALGIWFGVLASFVPTVGTYLAGILPILVALTIHPIDAVWIFGFVVLYQWFQDYLLQPRITARTVDVNAAVALLAALAGGALLGAVGALLAIPATATVQAFLSEYITRYEVPEDPRIERTTSARKRRKQAAAADRAAPQGDSDTDESQG